MSAVESKMIIVLKSIALVRNDVGPLRLAQILGKSLRLSEFQMVLIASDPEEGNLCVSKNLSYRARGAVKY